MLHAEHSAERLESESDCGLVEATGALSGDTLSNNLSCIEPNVFSDMSDKKGEGRDED